MLDYGMRTLQYALFTVTLLFFTACTQKMDLKVASQDPAVTTVAIIPFKDDTAQLSSSLYVALEKQPGLYLLKSTDLPTFQNTQQPLAQPTTLEIAKRLRVQKIILGQVDGPHYTQERFTVTKNVCKYDACWLAEVSCRRRALALEAEVTLLDNTRAQKRWKKHYVQSRAWQECADDINSTRALADEQRAVVEEMVEAISKEVTPYLAR